MTDEQKRKRIEARKKYEMTDKGKQKIREYRKDMTEE